MNKNSIRKGFTLVELLVVIAIIAILSTVSVIGYTSFIKKAAISNDNALVTQINSLINGQRVFDAVDDEYSIAELLQSCIEADVEVKSQDYDMDIYYNTDNKKFELMNVSDGNPRYKTLDHYLGLSLSNDNNDAETDEPSDDVVVTPNEITIAINSSYSEDSEELTEISDINGTKKKLTAFIDNNSLWITMSVNESGDIITRDIDLSKIITATDSSSNQLEVNFECSEEHKSKSDSVDYSLQGSILTINTPGKYQIKYSCKDKEGTLDLYAKNIYWPNDPQISIGNSIKYTASKTNNDDGTSNITFVVTEFKDQISITDYAPDDNQYKPVSIQYLKDISEVYNIDLTMTIILEIDGKTFEQEMNLASTRYSITLESIDLSADNTISVKYEYKGQNGVYCYSEETIHTVD